MTYIAGMPTLGLKLPLRICVLDESVCVEDANGRRTGYVYWSDEDQRHTSTGRFAKTEAIEQVRLSAKAWAEALGRYGVLDTSKLETIGDLLQARAIKQADLDAAVDVFLADPRIGLFELAPGCSLDLTAAVKADRHATATLNEPTARASSKRVAVRSALLLARPIKN